MLAIECSLTVFQHSFLRLSQSFPTFDSNRRPVCFSKASQHIPKMDPGMNHLLKWGIENSSADPPLSDAPPPRPIDPAILQAIFGGPSDADLMKQSMAAILSPDITLENKLTAFDNFEQLIESIDNANNLEPLGLWTPLVELMKNEEGQLRRMAAWCVGTAVQNNEKAQERVSLLAL